jgi:hypothetical protein
VGGGEASGEGGGEAEAGASVPRAEADPLVSNGLGSPLCKGVFGVGELPATGRRNCETSGFVAAAAPTGNYGIDVHINTGVIGLNLDTITQDIIVTPAWMAVVWAVHALVVMLEWSFTIDLLDSSAAGEIGSGLRQMQRAITYPWLAGVLAVASVILLYDGLIRRRVAESIGQAMLAFAMMAAGMWVILDPTATVGALGAWANRAGVGVLGVTASGTPSGGGRTLAESTSSVFATAVEAPWCYLEFGNVGWCRDPGRLESRLRGAGLTIASHELALIGCHSSGGESTAESRCVDPGSAQASAIEHSARLLRGAQNNGAVFLALPANGPARNSINEQGSLLHVLCQSSDSTECRGPTAAEAEFREGGGTWSRVGGLFLIIGGALGLLLLFGFVALRLLGAAILSLVYLLLAPAAVLAPALGEGGRELFRKWAVRLFGAVVAKLTYAFILGVLLAVVVILSGLQALGWWTQWLLMSAFWWGAFTHRHQALALTGGRVSRESGRLTRTVAGRATIGAVGRAVARRGRERVKEALSETDSVAPPASLKRPAGGPARARGRDEAETTGSDDQAGRSLAGDLREAHTLLSATPAAEARMAEQGARLVRLRSEQEKAEASGDGRRAGSLARRARQVDWEIARERDALDRARLTVEQAEKARRAGERGFTPEQREARERFLDAQATLAPGVPPSGARRAPDHRDYAALAGLAGLGRGEYEHLDPRGRREARLRIDRELAARNRRGHAAGVATPPREARSPVVARQGSGGERPVESSVMRDAREVAARRKRQLGIGRP